MCHNIGKINKTEPGLLHEHLNTSTATTARYRKPVNKKKGKKKKREQISVKIENDLKPGVTDLHGIWLSQPTVPFRTRFTWTINFYKDSHLP